MACLVAPWLLAAVSASIFVALFIPVGCIAPAALCGAAVTASERAEGKETAVTNGVITAVVFVFVFFLIQGVVFLILATA